MTEPFGGSSGENLPGYVLANTRLDWKDIGGSGLTLGVYVRNLFGERYFTSPSVLLKSVPVNSVYVGEPRTWGVTGRFNFCPHQPRAWWRFTAATPFPLDRKSVL